MTLGKDTVLEILNGIALPAGGTLVSKDLVRALTVEGGQIRFVLEAPTPDEARALEPVRMASVEALRAVDISATSASESSGTFSRVFRSSINAID